MPEPQKYDGKSSGRSRHEAVELHFYPGEKRLLFLKDGVVARTVEAWGGPPKKQHKAPGESAAPEPKTAGRYRVGWVGRYTTRKWNGWSLLPWGVPLAEDPHNDKDVLFESSPGRWNSVIEKTGHSRGDLVDYYNEVLGGPPNSIPDRWIFNDFGPIAIRYYPDRNNNRRQDKDEPLSGQMFHTTPVNETWPERGLDSSHGCIHLHPKDRQTLSDDKAFETGTLIVIHRYSETRDSSSSTRHQ